MKEIIGILIIVLTYGCNSSKERIIIAQNEKQSKSLEPYKTRLEMYRNGKYSISFLPYDTTFEKNTTYSGEYLIEKDTFYFKGNEIFKKAILRNGYVEFLENSFKILILENRTSIHSERQLQNQADFTFFTYNREYDHIFKQGVSVDLNENDITKIRELLQNTIKERTKEFIHYTNENEYYKQCIAIINNNNEKEVWIQCLSKRSSFSDDWETRRIRIFDGGDSNFTIKINLTTGEISDLHVNGYA